MAVYESLLLNTAVPQIQAAQAGDSYVMVVNATTPALRITQTGSGNALEVEDSANPDATPFVVTAAGDVGVGLSSPVSQVHAYKASGSVNYTAQVGANNAYFGFDGTNIYLASSSGATGVKVKVAFNAPDNSATLDPSGNLGLGVATPNYLLHLNGSPQIQLTNSTTGTTTSDGAHTYLSGADWWLVNKETAAMVFATDNTERARITSTGEFQWKPNGSTQAMTLDASGNLGVGTTSPKLNTGYATFTLNNVTNGGVVEFCQSDTTIGQLFFDGNGGTLRTSSNKPMLFGTNNTERARITSGGEFLVGTNTSIGVGGLTTIPNNSAGAPSVFWNRTATASTSTAVQFRDGGTAVGEITYTNTATAYVTSSDYRLKDNITPMSGALAKVAALKPVTYKWKSDGSDGEGFIAHELAEVVPQCVTGQKDAVDKEGKPVYQGIDTSFLVATLTAAIQEQQAVISNLTARISALEAK